MSGMVFNYKSSAIASMDASGTKTLLTSGKYCEDNIEVVYSRPSAPTPSYQSKSKSYTPSETAQSETVTADNGYDALSQVSVSVGAVSSTYVGSGITRRSSSDLTASGATVTAPSGYYSAQASKSVASMTLPTTTSNSEAGTNKADIFPSTSGTTYLNIPVGYNSTAQHYKIRALMIDYKPITANGTYSAASDDLDGFSSVIVDVPTVTITQSGSNLSIV